MKRSDRLGKDDEGRMRDEEAMSRRKREEKRRVRKGGEGTEGKGKCRVRKGAGRRMRW